MSDRRTEIARIIAKGMIKYGTSAADIADDIETYLALQSGEGSGSWREADWFEFLRRKYVQRADPRQRKMGLTYTLAETHDLARECAHFGHSAPPPDDGART